MGACRITQRRFLRRCVRLSARIFPSLLATLKTVVRKRFKDTQGKRAVIGQPMSIQRTSTKAFGVKIAATRVCMHTRKEGDSRALEYTKAEIACSIDSFTHRFVCSCHLAARYTILGRLAIRPPARLGKSRLLFGSCDRRLVANVDRLELNQTSVPAMIGWSLLHVHEGSRTRESYHQRGVGQGRCNM